MSQKSADPIYIAEEASNHRDLCFFFITFWWHLQPTQLLRKGSGSAFETLRHAFRYHCRTIHVFDYTNNAVLHCLHRHYLIIGLHSYRVSSVVLRTQRETRCTKRRI